MSICRTEPIVAVILGIALAGCGGTSGDDSGGGPDGDHTVYDAPWPADLDAVLTAGFPDPPGDQIALPTWMAAPPYAEPVPHPPMDITDIELGVEQGFVYLRVNFAGRVPTAPVHVPASGEVEDQWVGNQGMNVAMNVDGSLATGGGGEGVDGIDIFFAVGFEYGASTRVYANYGFPDGDLHHAQGQVLGEIGGGGAGDDHITVRYPVDQLGAYFPLGQTVDLGSWSEAESFDASGRLLYHHFAFDLAIDRGRWVIPGP